MSTQITNDKLSADLNAVIKDAEVLIKDTSELLTEKASDARKKLQLSISDAKTRIIESQKIVIEKAKQTAKATDEFVHEHPWKSVGIAAGAGFLIGYLIRRR